LVDSANQDVDNCRVDVVGPVDRSRENLGQQLAPRIAWVVGKVRTCPSDCITRFDLCVVQLGTWFSEPVVNIAWKAEGGGDIGVEFGDSCRAAAGE
jgi:hypothetical protein